MDDHPCPECGTLHAFSGEDFDPIADIQAFHEKFGLNYDGPPRILPAELHHFRSNFHQEEIGEYDNAVAEGAGFPESWDGIPDHNKVVDTLDKQMDAVADAIYVLLGTLYLQGMLGDRFRTAWNRVHAANMSKERCERAVDSKRGSTYDVIKGPDFVPPSHRDLVEDHAHKDQR